MSQNKTSSLIGLAQKAGKVASGEFSAEKAIKEGKARLVIVSGEASDNTKKRFKNMCAYRNVPLYFYGSKTELGYAIGKGFRSSLALLDEGLSKAIEKRLKMEEDGGRQYGENAGA